MDATDARALLDAVEARLANDPAFAATLHAFLMATSERAPTPASTIHVVDVTAGDAEITVTAEVHAGEGCPLEVSVQGRELSLSFENGHARTAITLPADVDGPRARATYRNGILDVVLPKGQSPTGPNGPGAKAGA